MTINTLIASLLRAQALINALVPRSESTKVAGQLAAAGLAFYNIATELRSRRLIVPSGAIGDCIREVDETSAAAEYAADKGDPERALVVVEANEAIELIYGSLADALARAIENLPRVGPDVRLDPRDWQPRPPHPWIDPPPPWVDYRSTFGRR